MHHFHILNTFMFGLLFVSSLSASADDTQGVHLILLSGQSNMANMDPGWVFNPELERHFGAENVLVVMVARKGQPIRRWYRIWKVTGDQNPAQIGDLYEQLMEETTTALSGRSIRSVTLIWMQGERDAKEHLSDRYEEAFLGILEQVQSDLDVSQIHYIIGRLSDWGLGIKDWDTIREVQQKLGEASPRSAWIDTDDLNDETTGRAGTALKGRNNLHYSRAGYALLAKRYVEKVKELLSTRAEATLENQ